ncbi:MAG: helix-turn-helix transcriptional regulator [Proteobacteria bacterium]|nr:helix-turn-helix transcriptional regulator [Pseudomonadota bacterium]
MSWYEHLADLVRGLGSPAFGPSLVAALRHVVMFDHMVIFAYRGDARPRCLFDTFTPEERLIFVTLYQEGPYLLDPFFHACRAGRLPALFRMRELAPDRFYQSEYFRSYYSKTGLAEEVGIFLPLHGGLMVAISLMRAGATGAFSDHDLARLRIVEPTIRAMAQRHWSNLARDWRADDAGSRPGKLDLDSLLKSAFAGDGRPRLTRRESEIASLVLRGHSSESIGRLLGVSPGTIKIHRKNIYRKLKISSQAEMFSIFLDALPDSYLG